MEIGARVGAILGASDKTVQLIGYGTYLGEQVVEEGTLGLMGQIMHQKGMKNPKIQLDKGGHVYGCECWWGSEEAIKARVAKFEEVIEIDMNAIREEYNDGAEAVEEGSDGDSESE